MIQSFTRTPTGMVGSRYFSPAPIVWVEGPTDIYFYEPIVGKLNCCLKAFHGASNASALINALKDNCDNYPYAVILDGDYSILHKRRSARRWIVVLKRYSFENYLWERRSLNRSCLKHAQSGEKVDVVGNEFDRVENELIKLRELVELDVAARNSNPAPKVLPDSIESLLLVRNKPAICPIKVKNCIAKVEKELKEEAVKQARRDVEVYLNSGRFSDLLNGHVLFGVIRLVFTRTTRALRKKNVSLNDDVLTQLLAEMVWREMPSKEHARLRTKIVSVVRELNKACSST